MKLITIPFLFIAGFSFSQATDKYSEKSFNIKVEYLKTPCLCNDALITVMKEEIQILEDITSGPKTSADSVRINSEYMKRGEISDKIRKHCVPVYDSNGGMNKCSNFQEGELLDKKLIDLRRKLRSSQKK